MICADVKPLLGPWVDAELPPDRRASVDEHLHSCDECRWTATLLEREERALRAALSGRREGAPPVRFRRTFVAAAVALVLLGGSLLALHHAYRQVGAGKANAASRPVLLRASGIPLADFAALLSDESGITVALDRSVDGRVPIDFELVEPIGLGSVLALLEELHGLHHRFEGGRILIRRGRDQP